MKRFKGFTLIELVMVIVILSILGVVAIPRFVDMRHQAKYATLRSYAATFISASAANHAANMFGEGTTVTRCEDAYRLIHDPHILNVIDIENSTYKNYNPKAKPNPEDARGKVYCRVRYEKDYRISVPFYLIKSDRRQNGNNPRPRPMPRPV